MSEIKLTPLKSSNIKGGHYNEDTQTLTIEFHNGGRYSYGGVVKSHWDAMQKAESPGSYLHKNIRGRFNHTKL